MANQPTHSTLNNSAVENSPALWLAHLPRPVEHSNKFTRGHALVIGGYPLTGAARLAAKAAARAGAGLTTVAVPEIAFPIYAASLTSIMVKPITKLEDFELILRDKRISACLVGSGAGVSAETRHHAIAILVTGKPCVLDADAISVFEDDITRLKNAIKGHCVMTPHEGEFGRVFETKHDRATNATNAAKASGAIVVLKGSETIIAAPDGKLIINRNAPPTLATAGSGDVLAGIITGLLAQGMDPYLAAAAGVWLHGEAANLFGLGLIAEDLPEILPKVLTNLYTK